MTVVLALGFFTRDVTSSSSPSSLLATKDNESSTTFRELPFPECPSLPPSLPPSLTGYVTVVLAWGFFTRNVTSSSSPSSLLATKDNESSTIYLGWIALFVVGVFLIYIACFGLHSARKVRRGREGGREGKVGGKSSTIYLGWIALFVVGVFLICIACFGLHSARKVRLPDSLPPACRVCYS